MSDGKQILVVDDNDLNRRILGKILMSEGYSVIEAENGQVAYDIVKKQKEKIALVLLDLVMPVMDGYEFLTKLDESALISFVPVIVVTGNDTVSAELMALEHGASDFITKPYNAEMVKHRVKSILRVFDNASLLNSLEYDSLTATYSREYFYRMAREMIENDPDTKYDIICSNVVNFKVINEKYGNESGNDLLKYIAKLLMEIMGSHAICGRLSADRFAVLCKHIDEQSAESFYREFNARLTSAPIKNVTIKFGKYDIEDSSQQVALMCDRALLAARSIKEKYGVFLAIYNDDFRLRMLHDQQIVETMEAAVEDKQFLVYLQPKHDTNTGIIAGAEALIRWQHPTLGFLTPGAFIEVFEKTGFITKLDRFVWEEACRVIKEWHDNKQKMIPISVNVSRIDFYAEDIVECITGLTDKYDIPREMLHLEVTESAYTGNPQHIIEIVEDLRSLGYKIEMDDFGSGYSSLNMLAELPIDILKLDMMFMQAKENNYIKKRNILSFVISLAKWLDLPVIAEGVETLDEAEVLQQMGCNYIQGYYFSKPLPLADFNEYKLQNESSNPTAVTNLDYMDEFNSNAVHNDSTVLVVEDVKPIRTLLDAMISPHYNVILTENGYDAHKVLKLGETKIDVILLDLMMPVMDGFQLLKLLNENEEWAKIPVIITSEANKDSELRALGLGAYGFVPKPYNAQVMLTRIKQALESTELRELKAALKENNK